MIFPAETSQLLSKLDGKIGKMLRIDNLWFFFPALNPKRVEVFFKAKINWWNSLLIQVEILSIALREVLESELI